MWTFSMDFNNSPMSLHENPSSMCQANTCWQADGQTDMTKLTGTLYKHTNTLTVCESQYQTGISL